MEVPQNTKNKGVRGIEVHFSLSLSLSLSEYSIMKVMNTV
jgi:hypothetical protein